MTSRRCARSLAAMVLGTLVLALSACGETTPADGADQAAQAGTSTESATPDPARAARAEAKRLARRGHYAQAAAALVAADLDADARRMRRRGSRALLHDARSALAAGRFKTAKRFAAESRKLRKTTAARTVLNTANLEIARAEAAARERVRLARIARDERTCTSTEKRTVRDGAGTPPGCASFVAEQATKAAEDEQGGGDCDPNYAGACLKPDSSDYDCAGGSGDGPDYTGPVQVVGDDPHGLDRDGDGSACESS